MATGNSVAGGRLGLCSCVMLLVGVMLGSAIFSLSGLTMLVAGPSALLSWLLGGAIMLCYGICLSELAMRFPRSGGVYLFPRMAFGGAIGRMLGWLSCWSAILTNIVAVAFSSIYVGQYLGVAFPWANGLQTPLALASILLCFGANAIRQEVTGRINAAVVMVLLATMMIYILCAFGSPGYSAALFRPFIGQGIGGAFGVVAAIPTAIIGYSGIVALAFMAATVRNPARTIPRAMAIAMAVVCGIYLLVIAATAGLVSVEYLKANPGMCFLPLFAACFTKLTAVPWLAAVVSVAAVLALVTTMLVCVSMNAWAIQAASGDGVLPERLGRLNSCGVPAVASGITCAIAMVAACFPQMTMQIVNFGAVFNIITMVLTMLALVKARCLDRDGGAVPVPLWRRPLPFVALLALLACNAVGVLSGGSKLWLYTGASLAVGVLIAILGRKSSSRRKEKTLH